MSSSYDPSEYSDYSDHCGFLTPIQYHLMSGFKYLFSEDTAKLLKDRKKTIAYIKEMKVYLEENKDPYHIKNARTCIGANICSLMVKDFILDYHKTMGLKQRMKEIDQLGKRLDFDKRNIEYRKRLLHMEFADAAWKKWVEHRMSLPDAPKAGDAAWKMWEEQQRSPPSAPKA